MGRRAAVMLGLYLVAAACTSNSDRAGPTSTTGPASAAATTVTVSEYLAEAAAVNLAFRSHLANEAPGTGRPDRVEANQAAFELLTTAYGDYRAGYSAVPAPPTELADQHAEFVAALDEVTDLTRQISAEMAVVSTEAELDRLTDDPLLGTSSYRSATRRLTAACRALEEVAAGRSLVPDLGCLN